VLNGIELVQKNKDELKIIGNETFDHYGFTVKNIEKVIEELEKRGVKLIVPLTYLKFRNSANEAKVYFFQDPDGNNLELVERINVPESGAQELG
jgi:extradiol dioxygenase family protein